MFYVDKSEIHGNGIFASQDIAKGELITKTHYYHKGFRLWVNIKPDCMYNHSIKNANCESITKKSRLNASKYLHAIKRIKKNEELLVNFFKDLDLEQPETDWK
tara:strand:- start:271 stop:579 length:309 start_codon:yes stop_codon:yes gene_type:complete